MPLFIPTAYSHSSPIGGVVSSLAASSSPDVVVISPPGGIGEIASIEAARLGGAVKWFVVSAPTSSSDDSSSGLALTAETLASIERAGGSMGLAGATSSDLLAVSDDSSGNNRGNDALAAMTAWCSSSSSSVARSLICTYDGAAAEGRRADRVKSPEQLEAGIDEEGLIRGAVRAAAQEAASSGSGGMKVAVLAAGEEVGDGDDEGGEESGGGGVGGLLAGLFGGNEARVPDSLAEAVGGSLSVIRHGELFGAAESSVSRDRLVFVVFSRPCGARSFCGGGQSARELDGLALPTLDGGIRDEPHRIGSRTSVKVSYVHIMCTSIL